MPSVGERILAATERVDPKTQERIEVKNSISMTRGEVRFGRMTRTMDCACNLKSPGNYMGIYVQSKYLFILGTTIFRQNPIPLRTWRPARELGGLMAWCHQSMTVISDASFYNRARDAIGECAVHDAGHADILEVAMCTPSRL